MTVKVGLTVLTEYGSDPGEAGTKLVSPEYVAAIVLEPAGMFAMMQVDVSDAEIVPPHPAAVICVPFSANVIVPFGATGVKVAPVRLAVNVTGVFTDALPTLGEILMVGVAAATT
jgi:hypothetical protein